MRILAIETSCDETAVAVVCRTNSNLVLVESDVVATSGELHKLTGGVVPEVAAREQLLSMGSTLRECLKKLGVDGDDEVFGWLKEKVDGIAVTNGPGLIGSLLVGVETAKTLSWGLEKPLFPINHLLGHVYANWLTTKSDGDERVPRFPALCLIVSGGHTELVLLRDHDEYEVLGATRDDAAGECFDKCARVMGYPYPGGPEIAKLAAGVEKKDEYVIKLPRPLVHENGFDFSFSGLKAAFLREFEKKNGMKSSIVFNQILAQELEAAVVEVLENKVLKAVEMFCPKSVLLAGGVAANTRLREVIKTKIRNSNPEVELFIPEKKYCSDNAAMIGAAAIFSKSPTSLQEIKAEPGLDLVN